MCFSHLTEATPYQCGTISRNGDPWSGLSGSPFISYAMRISAEGSAAWTSVNDRSNDRSEASMLLSTGFRMYDP